mmetsp:Transcript_25399/g.75035  ORF Transcript_25399/g.75035 Transcript_25399/m.75035 type:complete len:211 (-) Transcript_25399:601-1233(-)
MARDRVLVLVKQVNARRLRALVNRRHELDGRRDRRKASEPGQRAGRGRGRKVAGVRTHEGAGWAWPPQRQRRSTQGQVRLGRPAWDAGLVDTRHGRVKRAHRRLGDAERETPAVREPRDAAQVAHAAVVLGRRRRGCHRGARRERRLRQRLVILLRQQVQHGHRCGRKHGAHCAHSDRAVRVDVAVDLPGRPGVCVGVAGRRMDVFKRCA